MKAGELAAGGINGWVIGGSTFDNPQLGTQAAYPKLLFRAEADVVQPIRSPFSGDCVFFDAYPRADERLPSSLDLNAGYFSVGLLTPKVASENSISRHGKRLRPLPKAWPASQPPPGGINVSFFDGHTEPVPLERLWQLFWHKDYEPPAKRPGLP